MPTEASLHEAALRHLARYATTTAGLTRVLDRRVARWAHGAEADADATRPLRAAVRAVVARLASAGVVDDASFAAARARSLSRAGRSRRGIEAHLAARGVTGEAARAVLPADPDAEFAAAIAAARRRRIGPFRAEPADQEQHRRDLAILARAGFTQDVASRALRTDAETAEAILIRLRQA